MVLICLSSRLFFLSSFSRPRPLPAAQSRLASPLLLLLLLLRAILLCSRCSARCKYSLFAPPPDMAKGAICALLAILGHFFEAFSPLDLFFALAPFRPVPRPFPASLHPGCRRLVSPRSRTCPRLRLTAPVRPCQPSPAPRRAHQAPFYARGLLKIIAVSENAPGAHGDVPRAQGVPRARSIP